MNRVTSLLALAAVFGVGCTEYQVVEDDKGIEDLGDDAVPDIVVEPGQVNFGAVEVNDGLEHIEVVEVRNEGEADLHIENLALEDPNSAFTVSTIQSFLVAPGQSTQFEVGFTPLTAERSETFVYIDSDDPDTPTAEVRLLGNGIAPIIDVQPTTYDFGTVYVGCAYLQPITISNIGNADLVVSNYAYNTASEDLTFTAIPDLNGEEEGLLILAAGESYESEVAYAPFDEYPDVAYLSIESNDPFRPQVQVQQSGSGLVYGWQVDIFEQPIQGATDIIFAVDRSGSMSDDIANVQANFATYVGTLAGLDADYQVAATVEDNGCINGSDIWIDNTFSAAEAESTITAMIALGISYGSNTERAFMLLEACLDETGSGGCNEGLVREDAKLNLIGVSDEPEQSINSYSYYISLFQSYKDDADQVVIHGIGGDYPSGCSSASPYTGMYEATVATGGTFLSICATDWGSSLEELAEGSVSQMNSFQLTALPVPETIAVRIDGVTTTIGWSYNASGNAVEFTPEYIPEGGSTIEIEYALYGDCEA